MRKVCVVITARPSYSRIKSALYAMNNHPDLELQIVVTSSALLEKYGEAVKVMEKDGFDISDKIFSVIEGENLISAVKTTAIGMMELASVFSRTKPDVVVTIADRYETIATAIAASYMNIPLVHIQGGEVTGSIDEKVRHAITKLADIHLVSNEHARERVVKMGEDPNKVIVTGCPSIDLVSEMLCDNSLDFDPITKYGGSGNHPFEAKDFYIVIQHPVTTEENQSMRQITETLYAMKHLGKPTYWIWPNVDAGSDGTSKGIRVFREKEKPENIWFFKNIPSNDFLKMLYNCNAIIGNSSVAIRECSYMGVPAINIGTRQHGRDRSDNIIDVDYSRNDIINALRCFENKDRPKKSFLYGDGNAGEKIADIIAEIELSYQKTLCY